MKILLCGASGRVGGEINQIGPPLGIDIISYTSSKLDITNPSNIENTISEVNPDIVINSAAYMDIDGTEIHQDIAYRVNRDGAKFLAEACNHFNLPIIHISTDYVFCGNNNEAYNEESEPNPINIYGKSKLDGENAVKSFCNKHIIIRSSWIFGRQGNNFVKTILNRALSGLPIKVVTNEVGCPTSAIGLGNCVLEMAKQIYDGNSNWGIYHYCGSPEINRYQYALDIIKMAQNTNICQLKNTEVEPFTKDYLNNEAKRPRYSSMKTEKIFNVFGIKPDGWQSELIKLIPTLLSDSKKPITNN